MTTFSHGRMINFEGQLEELKRALVDFEAGARRNVAIIGQPFSGKTMLIDEAIDRYGKPIRKVSLPSIIEDIDEALPADVPGAIIAVDDCQYMYVRRIGGFGTMERFLDRVVSSGRLYITLWNQFSWDYLKEVFDMEDYFPVRIIVPPLTDVDVEALIRSRYDVGGMKFVNDARERGDIVKFKWVKKRLGGFFITVPSVRLSHFHTMLANSEREAREAVFERLYDLSMGNPGVALAIWQRACQDDTIRTSKLNIPDYNASLDFDEAFVLGSILMMKWITEEDLVKITAKRLKIDRILYLLMERGLIRKREDKYGIEPLALNEIVKSLKKSRQVW